ncbi:MAG: hypothetical protein FE044_00040 [Thermoplasmata archaeon]|nr:MAG: hypothetical protein FE044_00040 [Thermoplasmata archaeon]
MEMKDKIDELKSKYPLNVEEYNVLTKKGLDLLFKYYNAFHVSKNDRGSFAIFIGNKYYYKTSQFDELEEEIKKHLDTGLSCPEPSSEGNAEKIVEGFTVLTVMAGGLADGINPCAFATLIFFIAYLERIKQGKKALLSIGISFSMAVFLGYLMIGLGILEFYYKIEEVGIISKYVYLFAGIFALTFAIFNIWDYFKIEKKKKPILQLPLFLKKRRGRIIKILTQKEGIVILAAMAFIVGLAISLLEFVCTGQILIPIMAVIKSASPLKTTAFIYLLIYSVMFIVPLLIILFFYYIGYSSKALGEFQKRRHGFVKIFTALILLLIGGYMLYTAL